MISEDKGVASSVAPPSLDLNIVCGAGGTRSVLACTGSVLACHFAGISRFNLIGGASGGAIPTVLLAGGVHPVQIAHLTVETDFSSLLDRRCFLTPRLPYMLRHPLYHIFRPRQGFYGSERVGQFIEQYVPTWPKNYWTVAVVGESEWLFTADGVFQYQYDGSRRRLSDQPAPVGLAVRATSAIPFVFQAIPYLGTYLSDGGLSFDGRTPVRTVERHFGTKAESIVAVDLGDNLLGLPAFLRPLLNLLWPLLCGPHCPLEGKTPLGSEGTILIQPNVTGVSSLEFSAPPDQKWRPLMAGFVDALPVLEKAGLLGGSRLDEGRSITSDYQKIVASSSRDGELATRTATLMASHGLY